MEIARILKDEGFVADWHRIDRGPQGVLRVTLKYGPRKEAVLSGLTRVSRPGLRLYTGRTEIPRVRGGMGVVILTTSRGVMTDRQARRLGVGGGVIWYVWESRGRAVARSRGDFPMSRGGRAPIPIPQGVEVKVTGRTVEGKGAKGRLVREW